LAHKQRFNNQQTIGTEIQEQVMRERDTKRRQRQILRKRLSDTSAAQTAVRRSHWVITLTATAQQT